MSDYNAQVGIQVKVDADVDVDIDDVSCECGGQLRFVATVNRSGSIEIQVEPHECIQKEDN